MIEVQSHIICLYHLVMLLLLLLLL